MRHLTPSKVRDDFWVHAENPNPPADWTERSGKWLIFTSFRKLDELWKLIHDETTGGRLGMAAKAATSKPNALAKNRFIKVICVYTYDAKDKDDVMRVRTRLREIGFIKKLSYKTDEATELGVYTGTSEGPISLYYE
jgi:hypothetical protein